MPQKPYGLLCPISRACELLEPRWTIQIITELWNGSTRFSDIRKALGNISSALLSRRLKELEALGLIERIVDPATGVVDYIRTEKAVKLEPALHALAEWAQCNIEAEIFLHDADVSALMWTIRRKIDVSELPRRRTVIRFHFREPQPKHPFYWLVTEPGTVAPELCAYDPSLDVDLFVETSALVLGAILTGWSTMERELGRGGFFVSGDATLARTMDRWMGRSYYASLDGIASLAAGRSGPSQTRK